MRVDGQCPLSATPELPREEFGRIPWMSHGSPYTFEIVDDGSTDNVLRSCVRPTESISSRSDRAGG